MDSLQVLQSRIQELEQQNQFLQAQLQDRQQTLPSLKGDFPTDIPIAGTSDVRVQRIDQHGMTMMGRTEEEIARIHLENHSGNWQIYHWDGQILVQLEKLSLTRTTGQGEVIMNEEWIMRKPGEADIFILFNAEPIRGRRSEIREGTALSRRDRIQSKKIIREIQKLSTLLEQKVERRAQAFKESQQKLQRLVSELSLTEQREKRRLAGELHDYLAQLLVVCKMKLDRLRNKQPTPKGPVLV